MLDRILSVDWVAVIAVLSTVVLAASIALRAIAPLTKNTVDDRAVRWLEKVQAFLAWLALNVPGAGQSKAATKAASDSNSEPSGPTKAVG